MHGPRVLEIDTAGFEDAETGFARDQLLLLRCADDGAARLRLWRRPEPGLLLGRFHRADPDSYGRGLSRRMTGGRIVPAGPGVLCMTLAVPVVDWLDPAAKPMRPEQVLNRALRPLLAMLRGDGIAAFYPGRDLVTAEGRPIAHASFTVLRDGVALVEMQVAVQPVFRELASLLDRLDPAGVAGVDRDALASSTSLDEAGAPARDDDEWAERFASYAETNFACEVRRTAAGAEPQAVTLADARGCRDLFANPGPAAGKLSAAAVSMLGVVEASASMRGDRIASLEITGDLIAPFHTIDDIRCECEGEPLRPANVRKALARALARPRSFVLGLRELDELVLRIA